MAMPPKSACLSCNGAVIYIVLSTIHRLRSCRIPCISENIHRNLEFAFSKTGWLFGEIVKKVRIFVPVDKDIVLDKVSHFNKKTITNPPPSPATMPGPGRLTATMLRWDKGMSHFKHNLQNFIFFRLLKITCILIADILNCQ